MVMSLIESLTRIKNAVYGREVREAIHDGVFRANQIADGADAKADNTEIRQDAVEVFNNQVVQEMTDKDVISAPELIQARGGEATLVDRLDRDFGYIDYKMNGVHINVKDFGATGDGVTDDYDSIQAAINHVYSISVSGGVVFFPPGIYMLSAPLNVYNGQFIDDDLNATTNAYNAISNGPATHILLVGQSKDNTILKTMGNHPIVRPTTQEPLAVLYRITCRNIRFWGSKTNTSFDLYSSTGLPRDIEFYNCDFNHFKTGFEFNRHKRESDAGGIHMMVNFEICSFGMNDYGIDVNPDDTDFIKCRFERNFEFGIHVSGGNRLGFNKCKIQYNGQGTTGLLGGQIMLSGAITNLTFDDCYIENKSAKAENNVGSSIFYVRPADYDNNRTYLYNLNVTNSYINTFSAETLLYVADDVLALRGINFGRNTIRNLKPNPTTMELIRLPSILYCDGLIFDSFLDTIYNSSGEDIEKTSNWVLSTSDRILKINGYMNKYVPHLPIASSLGGSVSITAGSVNATANQTYFNGGFSVTKTAVGVYLITLLKNNTSTAGGHPSYFPTVASAAISGYHTETVSKTPNTFEVVVSNGTVKADSSFSFIAIQTVK